MTREQRLIAALNKCQEALDECREMFKFLAEENVIVDCDDISDCILDAKIAADLATLEAG